MDRDLELRVVPGLGEEAVDLALVDGPGGDLDVAHGGEHDAPHIGVTVAGDLEQLEPAHLGHHVIGDDDVDRVVAQDLQGLGPARSDMDDVAVVGQGELQGPADAIVVVDYQ